MLSLSPRNIRDKAIPVLREASRWTAQNEALQWERKLPGNAARSWRALARVTGVGDANLPIRIVSISHFYKQGGYAQLNSSSLGRNREEEPPRHMGKAKQVR